MMLATVTPAVIPDARMVICRGIAFDDGWLVYYTDLRSAKAHQLEECSRAACVFFRNALQRQIRIEGPVTMALESQADAYFTSRPAGAQICAWISQQSEALESRALPEERFAARRSTLAAPDLDRPAQIPRPDFWGGYRIWIETIEFWTGMRDRLHDRVAYRRELEPRVDSGGESFAGASWSVSRLWP